MGPKKRWGGVKKNTEQDNNSDTLLASNTGSSKNLATDLIHQHTQEGMKFERRNLAESLSKTQQTSSTRRDQIVHQNILEQEDKGSRTKIQDGDLSSFIKIINDEHTFCLPEFSCLRKDFTLFEKMYKELDFTTVYLSGGTKLLRPACIGGIDVWEKSITYQKIVRQLVIRFKISNPIRSIINLYRDGKDSTAFHKDLYFEDTNFTAGVSLGATRDLSFVSDVAYFNGQTSVSNSNSTSSNVGSSFQFPQHNGDLFAFSNYVNERFRHGVPKKIQHGSICGPRISVVLWGMRKGDEWDYHQAWKNDPENFSISISKSPQLTYDKPEVKIEDEVDY